MAVPPAADDLDRREKRSKIVAAYAAIATSVASVATAALVGWLTFSLNAGNSRSADLKACLEQSEKSAEYAFSAKVFDGANEGARDALLVTVAAPVAELCKRAGVDAPTWLRDKLQSVQLGNADLRQSAGEVIATLDTAANQTAAAPAPAPVTPPPTAAANGPAAPPATAVKNPVRLFIQISDESQRAALHELRRNLAGNGADLTLDGRPIIIPGIELVAPQKESQLRCLKTVDCAAAPAMAALIARTLGVPVRPLDISRRWNADPTVRAGTYELWLAPGELGATPAAPASKDSGAP